MIAFWSVVVPTVLFWVTIGGMEIRNNHNARTQIEKEIASEGGTIRSLTTLNPNGNDLPFLVKFETADGRFLQGTMIYLVKEAETYWLGSFTPLTQSTTPGFLGNDGQQFDHLSQAHDWTNTTDSKEQIISDLSAEIEHLKSQLSS